MIEYIETEVLVIGCGISGGTAALTLAEKGINVTLVTRTKDPIETNTYYAQGGIIYQGKDDSPRNIKIVRILVLINADSTFDSSI